MAKLFDIEEIGYPPEDPVESGKSGVLVERFINMHELRITSTKQLLGRLPVEGDIMFLHTTKSFTAFTFIPLVIKEFGIIDELVVATYSINRRIIDALVLLIEKGLIRQVSLTISDSIRQKNTLVYDYLVSMAGIHPIEVHLAWNHAKIALIRSGSNYFDVEGSGNWAENSMHEQYIFLNSRSVFEFRKNEIINGIDPVAV